MIPWQADQRAKARELLKVRAAQTDVPHVDQHLAGARTGGGNFGHAADFLPVDP